MTRQANAGYRDGFRAYGIPDLLFDFCRRLVRQSDFSGWPVRATRRSRLLTALTFGRVANFESSFARQEVDQMNTCVRAIAAGTLFLSPAQANDLNRMASARTILPKP